MKKSLLIAVILALCTLVPEAIFAQFSSVNQSIKDDLPNWIQNNTRRSYKSPTTCNQDTVEYARFKASGFNSIVFAQGSSLGQYYTAPIKGITVSGMTFYGWSIDSVDMKVAVNLYRASADSLPSGSPLRSDTITMDSSFGGGLLSVLEKIATFDSSIFIDFPYVVTVEVGEPNKRGGLVANSWTAFDGEQENLLCGSVSGLWYNGLNLNISGNTLDADMQFYPHVSYKFGTNFHVTDTCYNVNDTVNFVNHKDSSVVSYKYYNFYMYYKELFNNQIYEDILHRWNFGDNSFTYSMVNGERKYSSPSNYNIRLISRVYGWRTGVCEDTTIKQIHYLPETPGLSNIGRRCSGDSALVKSVMIFPHNVNWYRNTSDTAPFLNAFNYQTGPLSKNDTFHVRSENGKCKTIFNSAIIEVNQFPDDPTVRDDSVCTQSRANLSASSNVGNINWFTTPTGGTSFYTGEVYQTGILVSNKTFYVEANNNGCISTNRVAITAHVSNSFAPSDPVTSNDTIVCLRSVSTLTMTATASGTDTVRWFDKPSGGTPFKTGTTHTYLPTSVGNKTFYVEAWNGTCASSRISITITTQDYPDIITSANDTICKGEDAQLTAMTNFGEVWWYDTKTGGVPTLMGNVIDLVKPQSSETYYVESRNGACALPVRQEVVLIVNDFAPFTEIKSDTICSEAHATLTAKVDFGQVNWYDVPVGGTPVHIGQTFNTPSVKNPTPFFVESSNMGCTSNPREIVDVFVKARPLAGFEYNVTWPATVSFTPLTMSGATYYWDFGDGNNSIKRTVTHTYGSYNTYTVMQELTSTSNGCKDSATVNITVDFTNVDDVRYSVLLYPNPNEGSFTIESKGLSAGEWEVTLTDLTGRVVYDEKRTVTTDKMNIDFPYRGMYIVQLKNGDNRFTSKVSIVR
jgi:hypothetical protein